MDEQLVEQAATESESPVVSSAESLGNESNDPRTPRKQTLEQGEPSSLSGRIPNPSQQRSFHPSQTSQQNPFDSMSSRRQRQGSVTAGALSPLSPNDGDRVFPMSSVVSVQPTPMARSSSGDGFSFRSTPPSDSAIRGSARQASDARSTGRLSDSSRFDRESATSAMDSSPLTQVESSRIGIDRRTSTSTRGHAESERGGQMNILVEDDMISEEGVSTDGGASMKSKGTGAELDPGLVTARFQHVVDDRGHAVITGRDGDPLQRCEDEPIHIPGAVQSYGLLIALREEEEKLVVRVVSENSKRIIGYTPQQLFALSSFLDILTEQQSDDFLDHLDFIREEASDLAIDGPEVFLLTIRPPRQRSQKLWCAMHINEANKDLIICEFELENDTLNPLVSSGGDPSPEPPEDTLGSKPTPEEYAESTVNKSKPLRVLRSARKKASEAAALDVFNVLSQIQEQLASAPNLQMFLKVLVGVVKELTGFHRVMVYQFDNSWNGRVVAELVDPRATKDLYMGLNFPASDIPKQARDLYKINKVRLIYDRDQETARLVCRTLEDLDTPLDLTHSYLRAMSPIHVKYLANMAVRASMSISINAFNELWGLISCHSYGSKGMRVSFPIRKMCRLVGDTASRNIERLSYASRLQARKLINTMPTEHNPGGYIVASSEDLLKLFDADCGALSIRGETKILGKPEETQEILALLEYLRMRRFGSVQTSAEIDVDFPDLSYPLGFRYVAGLLYVPLSPGGDDYIVFFRKGQLREVKWAGNPYEKFIKEGTEGFLEPRKSFRTWSEMVVGKCKDWTEDKLETAAVLCLVYGKFIEVWRQKESAIQNSQLTKLLLANSAHEVRTPLHQIVNFLEIALEGPLDGETREALSKSHSASKSLIYVINDLLDLTRAETGQELIRGETFDLSETVGEATDMFRGEARRKNVEYEVEIYPGVPKQVTGDQRRVRQVVSNIIANAIQHTSSGRVKVEVFVSEQSPERVDIEFVIEDTGVGMSPRQLDSLFRALEQVTAEEGEGDSDPSPETREITKADSEERTLGLGLAVVARLLRLMDGQMRLKSDEGKGSRFVVQLSFDLPQDNSRPTDASPLALSDSAQGLPTTPVSTTEGEITLVNRSTPKQLSKSPLTRRESSRSLKSMNSTKSLRSGRSQSNQKNDIERLIDAIQESPRVSKSSEDTLSHDTQSPRQKDRTERPRADRAHSASHIHEESPGTAGRRSARISAQGFNIVTGRANVHRGEEPVVDSRTPVKPIRMPEVEWTSPPPLQSGSQLSSKVMSGIIGDTDQVPFTTGSLRVLVAEDDPINSRIVKKRLEKMGHQVYLTINGEECASAHGDTCAELDVVLMDIQMPIVDGVTSTKMIRSFEKTHPGSHLSRHAALNGRIPIFAVSASLVEKDKQTYIDTGFDGWILKPIDFTRVETLLNGIVDETERNSALYEPGQWEKGGWFEKRRAEAGTTDIKAIGSSNQNTLLPHRQQVASPEALPSHPPAADETGIAKIG